MRVNVQYLASVPQQSHRKHHRNYFYVYNVNINNNIIIVRYGEIQILLFGMNQHCKLGQVLSLKKLKADLNPNTFPFLNMLVMRVDSC